MIAKSLTSGIFKRRDANTRLGIVFASFLHLYHGTSSFGSGVQRCGNKVTLHRANSSTLSNAKIKVSDHWCN